jgi:hypothetical protein
MVWTALHFVAPLWKQMASADDYFIHTTFDLLSGVLKTKINAVVNCKV